MRVTVRLMAAGYSGLDDESQCKTSNVEAGRGAGPTRWMSGMCACLRPAVAPLLPS